MKVEAARSRPALLVTAFMVLGCNPTRDHGVIAAKDARPSASQPSSDAEPPPADTPTTTTASLDLPPEHGSSGCNLSVFGGTDRHAFDVFDARMRSAARSDDPSGFADLVIYPLRVNRDGRTIIVDGREEFVRDSARIFTASARKDIAGQHGFFCRDDGLMYGAGTVWVGVVPAADAEPERYGVRAVNVPEIDPTRTPSRKSPELKLRCVAPAYTVVVEDVGDDTLRYRSWRSGQSTTARPDLVLERGTMRAEGTGACAHAIYTFENGDTTYDVSELGCTDGSEPSDATGWLTISRRGRQLAEWLCRTDGPANHLGQ
jgi:hypothetical protein